MSEPRWVRPDVERRNVDSRVTNPEGHDVQWDLSVWRLFSLRCWAFRKHYRTHCAARPSAWFFEMKIPEVRLDGTCSLSVLMRREDTAADIQLEGSVWIDVCDTNDHLIFRKLTFTQGEMLPGHSIQETVNLTPIPDMKDAVFRQTKVVVTLMVSFCHSEGEGEVIVATPHRFPKPKSGKRTNFCTRPGKLSGSSRK